MAGTISVYELPDGVSVGGIYHLIGNVWEWTSSNFGVWDASRCKLDTSTPMKSIRGGAFDTYFDTQATCQFQSGEHPIHRKHNIGFRCALAMCDVDLHRVAGRLWRTEFLDELRRTNGGERVMTARAYFPWTPIAWPSTRSRCPVSSATAGTASMPSRAGTAWHRWRWHTKPICRRCRRNSWPTIGSADAGKTVYLGMLTDMLSRGRHDLQLLARGAVLRVLAAVDHLCVGQLRIPRQDAE